MRAPEPIRDEHVGESFDCGDEALNSYLRRFALSNHRQGSARTYVVCRGLRVVGYYSLAIDLGRSLLKDAMRRYVQAQEIAGCRALLTHAKDEAAAAFYKKLGFLEAHLYLLTKDILRNLSQKTK